MTGSNRRPPACKAGALPAELILRYISPGNVLLSQGEIPQLPLALKSLTSVFGMGTGVTSSPLSPDSSYPFKGQVLLYNTFNFFQGFFKNYSLKTR
jgi:hypothetical protein